MPQPTMNTRFCRDAREQAASVSDGNAASTRRQRERRSTTEAGASPPPSMQAITRRRRREIAPTHPSHLDLLPLCQSRAPRPARSPDGEVRAGAEEQHPRAMEGTLPGTAAMLSMCCAAPPPRAATPRAVGCLLTGWCVDTHSRGRLLTATPTRHRIARPTPPSMTLFGLLFLRDRTTAARRRSCRP
jgi:hypothetical protein